MMTRFQARYVQWLTAIGCTLRATAGNYYSRYDAKGNLRKEEYRGFGGNQLDGIFLREEAKETLLALGEEPLYLEDYYGVCLDEMEGSYCEWKRRFNKMSELKDIYEGALNMLGQPYGTKDWKLDGLNEQGFPIIKSEEQNLSFSLITFELGLKNKNMILDENYSISVEKDNVTLYYKKYKGINEKTGKEEWSKDQTYYPSIKLALAAYLDRCLKENDTIEGVLSEIKRVEEIINKLK